MPGGKGGNLRTIAGRRMAESGGRRKCASGLRGGQALLGLCIGLLLSGVAPAAALIEEVVVVAQKREQNIQDVGASVTAITGAQIQALGVDDVAGVTRQTPNFNYSAPAGEGTTPGLSIRGVGVNSFTDTVESPVAMYVDEVLLGTLPGQAALLFDLERVEVLRGPQGTLYGRNNTAGLVHFMTRKPSAEFEAYGEATLGSYDRIKFEGAAGGALSERVRARASFLHDANDGHQVDQIRGGRGAAANVEAYRLQLDIDLNAAASLLLNLHGANANNTPTVYKHRGLLTAAGDDCPLDAIQARQCVDRFGFRDESPDPDRVTLDPNVDIDLHNRTFGASAKLDWERGPWRLVSITAFENVDKTHTEASFVGIDLPNATTLSIDADQVTQEVRLHNDGEGAHWLLGFYYFGDNKEGRHSVGPPQFTSFSNAYDQDTSAFAFFTHWERSLSARLTADAGLRFTSERKDVNNRVDPGGEFNWNSPPNMPAFPPFMLEQSFKSDDLSWDFGLNWELGDASLLFLNIARGFKSGGFDSSGFLGTPEELAPYDSERITLYEAGLKTVLAQGRLRLNLTAFHNDYEDFQASTPELLPGGVNVAIRLTNAGSAKVSGFEAELTAAPAPYFDMRLGLGYLRTKTANFTTIGQDGTLTDLSGSELVLAPALSANGVFRLLQPMLGGEGVLQVDFNYSDEYFFSPANQPIEVGGDYLVWNLRASWSSANERYQAAVFVNNLSDKRYVSDGFDFLGMQALIYNQPRTAGLSLRLVH